MNRRTFMKLSAAVPAVMRTGLASTAWRTFEVRVKLDIREPSGLTRAWIPLPLSRETSFQRNLGHTWEGNASVKVVRDPVYGADIFCAEWPASESEPRVEVTMRVATSDVSIAFDAPTSTPSRTDLDLYLRPTALLPLDGIVRETAEKVTRGHQTELSRARALYEWIVENTVRDPKVRGCGRGDIRFILESGDLSGKCADINALYVGLARACGLPARDLYGIRVAPSARFPSLGRAGTVTGAQHCRAEVYLEEFGWVPVDPADVRKVILEERPDATLEDPHVADVRRRLFGSWEMNWIAFNDAHDLALPDSAGKPVPYFMYPEAEAGGARKDSLDPGKFVYEITSQEVVSKS